MQRWGGSTTRRRVHHTKPKGHHTTPHNSPAYCILYLTIETMENLTTQQRDEVLKIFGEIYENAQRHKTCRQLSYWSETVERVLEKWRDLLWRTYDGIFGCSATYYIQQHGRKIDLENLQFSLALAHALRNQRNA